MRAPGSDKFGLGSRAWFLRPILELDTLLCQWNAVERVVVPDLTRPHTLDGILEHRLRLDGNDSLWNKVRRGRRRPMWPRS